MTDAVTKQVPAEVESALRKLARAAGKGSATAAILGSVSADGSTFRSADEVYKSGIRLVRKDKSYKITLSDKAVAEALNEDDVTDVRMIGETSDPFNYSSDNVIEPPWNFNTLASLLVESTYHAACVEVKASDYAYNQPQLFLRPGAENYASAEELRLAKEEVFSFLTGCNDGRSIEDLLKDVAMEYEALGCAAIEIRRNAKGFIGALTHVPFSDVRALTKKFTDETGAKYLQRKFGKRVYYTGFNDPILYMNKDNEAFNPVIAADSEFPSYSNRDGHIAWDTPYVSYQTAEETNVFSDAANELFVLTRAPYTRSRIYGTPAGISAYPSMLAQMKIDEYNLNFFSAQGVPQYAVIFEGLSTVAGGSTSDVADEDYNDSAVMTPDATAQLRETVRTYFKKELAAGNRSILVLTLTGDAKVTFQKLSSDELEASFEHYELRCRDKIRVSHRCPSTALGIDITNTGIGGNRESAQMRRYRDHVVVPGQRLLENVVNSIIRCGLLIPYYEFKFTPMSLEDEAARKEFALKEYEKGAITLNEYRAATGKPPLTKTNGDIFILRSTNLTMIESDPVNAHGNIRQSIGYEKQLRRALSGAASLSRIDRLQETINLLNETEDDDASDNDIDPIE